MAEQHRNAARTHRQADWPANAAGKEVRQPLAAASSHRLPLQTNLCLAACRRIGPAQTVAPLRTRSCSKLHRRTQSDVKRWAVVNLPG